MANDRPFCFSSLDFVVNKKMFSIFTISSTLLGFFLSVCMSTMFIMPMLFWAHARYYYN